MQYTYDKRLAIGKEIVTGKITTSEAADKYSIGLSTAKLYAKQYRDRNNIPSPANSHKPTTFKSADFDIPLGECRISGRLGWLGIRLEDNAGTSLYWEFQLFLRDFLYKKKFDEVYIN